MPWDFWLIFAVMIFVLPWRGRARMQSLLQMETVATQDRLRLYGSAIAFQWVAASLVAWRVHAHSLSWTSLGVSLPVGIFSWGMTIVGGATIATLHWFNLRRTGRAGDKVPARMRGIAERVFPRTAQERTFFFALALTAGICEEFLYRGFAMRALQGAGLAPWGAVLLSSLLFGLAHIYQGRGGFVGTFLLGLVFAMGRIAYDSLVPVILWHAALDVIAGLAGARFLVRAADPASTVPS